MVSFSTLFAASIFYFELFMKDSGYLRPLGDAPLLIDFPQGSILLNGR